MSNQDSLYSWKLSSDDDNFNVEFEVGSVKVNSSSNKLEDIEKQIQSIDLEIERMQDDIGVIDKKIEKLTNYADGLDYTIAVSSGVISGVIDSFFVGEFSFDEGAKWGTEKVNNFVIRVAKIQGYKGNDLTAAVKFLEGKWQFAADKATNDFGGGFHHHLRDFTHHPSPVGLLFSLLTQFTGNVYGTSTQGSFIIVDVSNSGLIGKSIPQKIYLGTIQWFFHLVSDIAGSSSSLEMGKLGTGLPGPIVSLLKELSSLPIFKHDGKGLSLKISKLFNGTLFAKQDENGKVIKRPFDLRTEIGVAKQVSKQSSPIIINECIVRAFYFIRRFCGEMKRKSIHNVFDLKDNINWNNVLPWKNRTIVRMLTISTGTFAAIDLTDAAIRSAVKTRGITPAFWGNLALRINFVGIGRFSVAVFSDVKMEFGKNGLVKDRQIVYTAVLKQTNAKIYYKQAQTWVLAKDSSIAIEILKKIAEQSICNYCSEIKMISEDIESVKKILPSSNDKLRKDLLDALD